MVLDKKLKKGLEITILLGDLTNGDLHDVPKSRHQKVICISTSFQAFVNVVKIVIEANVLGCTGIYFWVPFFSSSFSPTSKAAIFSFKYF